MKNEYIVTEKMYQSWLTHAGLHGKGLLVCISFCSLAVICAVMIATHPNDPYSILYAVALIYCLYTAFLKNAVVAKKQYKSIMSLKSDGEWKRTITFNDNAVLVDDGFGDGEAMELLYSKITSAKEKDNAIDIYFGGGGILCLYKDCFTEGSFEQCKAFLSEKNPKIKFK